MKRLLTVLISLLFTLPTCWAASFEDSFGAAATTQLDAAGYTPYSIAGSALASNPWVAGDRGHFQISNAGRARITSSAATFVKAPFTPTTTEYDVEADWTVKSIDTATFYHAIVSHVGANLSSSSGSGATGYNLGFVSTGTAYNVNLIHNESSAFGASFTVATITGGGFAANDTGHAKITVRSNATTPANSDVACYITRASDSKYLKSDGTWQVGSVACITYTDNGAHEVSSAAPKGSAGLYGYDLAGDTSGIHWDNFKVSDSVSALVAGTLTRGTVTATSIGFTAIEATGGSSPYAKQLQRATSFAGTFSNVSGQTTLTPADTTAVAGTQYVYRVRYTDSASAVVYSNLIPAQTWQTPIVLGFIGDSLYAHTLTGVSIPQKVVAYLNRDSLRRRVWTLGVNGGVSSSTWSSWAPADASNNLSTYQTNATAASVTHTVIMLGTNVETSSTMLAKAALIEASELTAGRKVIYMAPPFRTDGAVTTTNLDDLRALQAGLLARANGTTVFFADATLYEDVAANPTWLSDGVHLDTTTGSDEAAIRQAAGISKAIDAAASGSTGGTPRRPR